MGRTLWLDWVSEGFLKRGMVVSDGVKWRAYSEDSVSGRFIHTAIRESGLSAPTLFMSGTTMHITLARILDNGTYDQEMTGKLTHSLPTSSGRREDGAWWSMVTPVDFNCPKCQAPFPTWGNHNLDQTGRYHCIACRFSDTEIDF
jgi:hypothetical protein